MQNLLKLKKEMVKIGRRMYERGYVASNDGNISVRFAEDKILITPSGVSKGFMKPDEMVLVNLEGKVLSGTSNPSSELEMHLKIYEKRPCVQSICHAHPVYATAFSAAGRELDSCLLSEMVFSLGKVPLVGYGTPGTEDIFKDLLPILSDYDAFLLANHGVVTVGQTLLAAYHKLETVEHGAKITYLAEQLGGGKLLSEAQVKDLAALKQAQGISTKTDCLTCEQEDSCDIKMPQESPKQLIEEIVSTVLKRLNLKR